MLEIVSSDKKFGCVKTMPRAKAMGGKTTVKLEPLRSVFVQVKDPSGKPVSDVKLRLYNSYFDHTSVGMTDSEGYVLLGGLFRGEAYSVQAAKLGYFCPSCSLPEVGSTLWADKTNLVMLPANRTQKGVVLDENGNPFPGITVQTAFGAWAVTNEKGEFVMNNLPDSEVYLNVQTADAYGGEEVSVNTKECTIQLTRY